ncbi:acyclic terpene utilization AtuA family protein [Aquamicrobium sp. LC103]|uniref:acyclic terpene utilization AtuA family protein n=1 Tax=Aquamicrobium sp. LC103 TaxID=1120658 RepID=UPI00063E8BB3|nr:acyclic terpene utilization AtuA family protein [Aquamicrobium sp. LC103]TKT78254.1 DUF1446 domain-containing protein [Aquamicrobium sp. LC103]
MKTVRIGAGAGFSGDRIEPAVELIDKGGLDYVVFECLAERTIALAQERRADDPQGGYDPLLAERFEAILELCRQRGTRVITNMGAANPAAAGTAVIELARRMGLPGLKVAAVMGDDVLSKLDMEAAEILEYPAHLSTLGDRVISANAYMGIDGIVEALAAGADVVLTGRVGDPALFLAPLVHEFGWARDDWDLLGQGTLIGHLLECAGQLTGGYFADPGYKDVPDLARLGFPYAEVSADGTAILAKVDGSGGAITLETCREQLLYEVLDPENYIQPDVIADFSAVELEVVGADRVRVSGARGKPKPPHLKVSVGYRDSFAGEGQISYAGSGAVERGRLAIDIIAERFKLMNLPLIETRYELIGVDAVNPREGIASTPREVRVRVVARTETLKQAQAVGNEVETLYTNGPAGGGGASKSARQVIAIVSTLIDRRLTDPHVELEIA